MSEKTTQETPTPRTGEDVMQLVIAWRADRDAALAARAEKEKM